MASLATNTSAAGLIKSLSSDFSSIEGRNPSSSCAPSVLKGTSAPLQKLQQVQSSNQLRRTHVSKSAASSVVATVTDGAAASAAAAPMVEAPNTIPEEEQSECSEDIQEPSAFMADVSNLIRLVDSRDIVELELKHKSYEIVIRKAAALQPQQQQQHVTFPGPHVMAHSAFPPQYFPAPPSAPPAAPVPAAAAAPPAAPAKPLGHPPMLSPMAGTFYRSPAPGEPPIVKVGDRVTKGQVVCIVEAMKLMNEIEADQTGTIVDIIPKDGSGVAIESPLFLIQL